TRYTLLPPVRLFVMGDNVWRDEQEWPLERTVYQNWYIHSNGRAGSDQEGGTLSPMPPGQEPPDRFEYNPADPVPTRGGNILRIGFDVGPCDQRRDCERSDILTYV